MPDSLSTDLAALRIDRTQRPPSAGGPLKTALIVLAIVGVGAVGYTVGKPYAESKLFKTEVAVTEIATVSPAQASVELTATGYVVAQSVSKVSVKVGGKIAKVYVKQSDTVKAGDVLFEIDPRDHEASIASARSQAAAARARAVAARAGLVETEIQAKRALNLAAEGVAPKSNAEDLAARVTSLKEQANASEAEARASTALVSALEINKGNFTVRAPISGVVVNRPPEVGEFVGPQPAGLAVDMGGVEISDFNTLMVETDVPEQRLALVKVGRPAEIVLDAYPDRRYRGKVAEITPKIDRAKATVLIKVAFVDEKTGVLPNMAARVSFLTAELDAEAIKAKPKTIVPASAIVSREGSKSVFVIDEGKVHLTPVALGPSFGSGFELARGPASGTRLVKDPPANLADGQPIRERTQE
ncbi:MAG TPA: efflux RND transporter periplasmic adaptor subunit [Polyangiaceae bacterium]|nr:efflux RND transporter periplasmic adaptor subunit [Polyangiaceae bacterium]